jgi:hypothetical protein
MAVKSLENQNLEGKEKTLKNAIELDFEASHPRCVDLIIQGVSKRDLQL